MCRSSSLAGAQPSPVRQQYSRLLRIRQIRLDHLAKYLLTQFRVAYVEHHLHALVNIPVHPIRAAQIKFRLATVSKHKNPAVFQKSPDHAPHPNPAADPAHSRPKRARSRTTSPNRTPPRQTPAQSARPPAKLGTAPEWFSHPAAHSPSRK